MSALRKDGQLSTVELVGTAVRDPQGTPVCMLGSFSDITERKQTEEALRASEAALRRAQQVAHIGTWTWHIRENRLGSGLLDRPPQSLVGLGSLADFTAGGNYAPPAPLRR